MATRTRKLSMVDFPEEVDVANGIKVYGEVSYENQMAVLSHYLHNHGRELSKEERDGLPLCVQQ